MKGNYGIRLAAYTVLAFLLAYFGSTTLLFLVLGVVLLAEKNEWAVRQVLQAMVLYYIEVIVRNVLGVFDFIYDIAYIGTVWRWFVNFTNGVVALAVLVAIIVGIVRNLKDKEANIPVANSIANWICGIAKAKAEPAPAPAVEEAPKAEETAEQTQE